MTTRKSVEEKYELMYGKLIASKETEVFKKQIVFLYKDNDDIMIGFRNEIRDRGYTAKLIQASARDVTSKLSDASIVVYRVGNESVICTKKLRIGVNQNVFIAFYIVPG